MPTGRDLRRLQYDLAQRRAPTREAAAARAHRGAELARAALAAARAGVPPPEGLDAMPAAVAPARPVRVEVTACANCYSPHDGPPDSLCDGCKAGPDTQPITSEQEIPWP